MKIKLLIICLLLQNILVAQEIKQITFLGASITSGFGIGMENSFPAIYVGELKKKGIKVQMFNAASAGAATSDGLSQFNEALEHGTPNYLFVFLGISDAVYGVSPATIKKNIVDLIGLARTKNPDMVIFLGQGKIFQRHISNKLPKPDSQYNLGYENVFAELSREHHLILLPFILDPIVGKMQLFQRDQLHPNRKGAEIVAKQLLLTTNNSIE